MSAADKRYRTAATEAALRCVDQRHDGHHTLPLSEIHRIWAGEYSLDADGQRGLAAALEHYTAALADRKKPA